MPFAAVHIHMITDQQITLTGRRMFTVSRLTVDAEVVMMFIESKSSRE